MRIPLGLLNLLHSRTRTLVALAGVTFSVVLIFMQLGFYGAVLANAVKLFDVMDFDIMLTSKNYLRSTHPEALPRNRLYESLAVSGVATARPVYIGQSVWRNPVTRQRRVILVMAFNPNDRVFTIPEVNDSIEAIRQTDTVLFDRLSQPQFGPRHDGVVTEIDFRRVEIRGRFSLGTGFIAYGAAIMSDQNFRRLYYRLPLSDVSLGLVKLQPGADPDEVARRLRAALPADVLVRTRAAIEADEREYWIKSTSTGITFGSGVVVALAVGLVIMYQILSTEITSRTAEFATLRAMGYADSYLSAVVFQQAVIIALASYLPAVVGALIVYAATRAMTGVPIGMDGGRLVAVFALSLSMCVLSGLLTLRKIKAADPAELY